MKRGSPILAEGRITAARLEREPLLLYTGGWDRCLWWPEPPRIADQACSDLEYLFSLLREGQGVLPLPEVLAEPVLEYAEPLETDLRLEPGCIYFSTLYPTYYNAITYDLLSSVYRDVLDLPLDGGY